MIRIKISKGRGGAPVCRMHVPENERGKYQFLKRALLESKKVKGRYEDEIPLKYLLPIVNNLKNDEYKIDKFSISNYLEFSDEYEGEFFYTCKADAKYMRIWREESCPYIYKVIIDAENNDIRKIEAFKKISF